jgi:hypothetical protein
MPIYEFYCPDNHRIYQFYARTLAQGAAAPPCPDNPAFRMRRILSAFAVVGAASRGGGPQDEQGAAPGDARMDAALGQIEREFSSVDEGDPRSMGRMVRRMAELTGEPIGGEMEEAVRRLEEGADPEPLGDELAGTEAGGDRAEPGRGGARGRPRRPRGAPARDPRLDDYP